MCKHHQFISGNTISAQEQDRQFANVMRSRADNYLSDDNLATAEKIVAAASDMLVISGGGFRNEVGVWIRNTEARIASRRKQYSVAVTLFGQALYLAEDVLGKKHPALVALLANKGEAMMELGIATRSAAIVRTGVEMLRAGAQLADEVKPHGVYTRSFIDDARVDIARNLDKAAEALGQQWAI